MNFINKPLPNGTPIPSGTALKAKAGSVGGTGERVVTISEHQCSVIPRHKVVSGTAIDIPLLARSSHQTHDSSPNKPALSKSQPSNRSQPEKMKGHRSGTIVAIEENKDSFINYYKQLGLKAINIQVDDNAHKSDGLSLIETSKLEKEAKRYCDNHGINFHNLNIIHSLIKKEIDTQNPIIELILNYAAFGRDINHTVGAIRVLFATGVNIDETYSKRPQHSETPLILAASHGFFEIVKCLLELGADPSYDYISHYMDLYNIHSNALLCSIKKGHLDCATLILETLLKTEANPNVVIDFSHNCILWNAVNKFNEAYEKSDNKVLRKTQEFILLLLDRTMIHDLIDIKHLIASSPHIPVTIVTKLLDKSDNSKDLTLYLRNNFKSYVEENNHDVVSLLLHKGIYNNKDLEEVKSKIKDEAMLKLLSHDKRWHRYKVVKEHSVFTSPCSKSIAIFSGHSYEFVIPKRECKHSIPGYLHEMCLSHNQKLLAICGSEGCLYIQLFDLSSASRVGENNQIKSYKYNEYRKINSIAISPDGLYVGIVSERKAIILKLEKDKLVEKIIIEDSKDLHKIKFSSDSQEVTICGDNGLRTIPLPKHENGAVSANSGKTPESRQIMEESISEPDILMMNNILPLNRSTAKATETDEFRENQTGKDLFGSIGDSVHDYSADFNWSGETFQRRIPASGNSFTMKTLTNGQWVPKPGKQFNKVSDGCFLSGQSGTHLATVSMEDNDNVVSIWQCNGKTWQKESRFNLKVAKASNELQIICSPDGRYLAIFNYNPDNAFYILTINDANNKVEKVDKLHIFKTDRRSMPDRISSLTFTSDSNEVIVSSQHSTSFIALPLQAQENDALDKRKVKQWEKEAKGKNLPISAAKTNYAKAIQTLKNQNYDLNARDEGGNTPLMIASGLSHMDTVNALIGCKADVSATNHCGENALMLAARYGHKDLVNTLLNTIIQENNRTSINLLKTTDASGLTVLDHAANNKDPEVVKILLDACAKGWEALEMALEYGNENTVLELSKKSYEFNELEVKTWLNEKTNHATNVNTALIQAIKECQPELVKQLLDKLGDFVDQSQAQTAINLAVNIPELRVPGFIQIVNSLSPKHPNLELLLIEAVKQYKDNDKAEELLELLSYANAFDSGCLTLRKKALKEGRYAFAKQLLDEIADTP